MLGYYLDLALRSLRRNKALTALMVVAIALGIGASMTTLTVLHVLSGDPLPGKSAQLYYPQIDPQDIKGMTPSREPPEQVTLIDGLNLLHAGRADRQALMAGGSVPVDPGKANVDPFYVETRYTTTDFFPMFDTPFLFGHAWTAADDEAKARDVVIAPLPQRQALRWCRQRRAHAAYGRGRLAHRRRTRQVAAQSAFLRSHHRFVCLWRAGIPAVADDGRVAPGSQRLLRLLGQWRWRCRQHPADRRAVFGCNSGCSWTARRR